MLGVPEATDTSREDLKLDRHLSTARVRQTDRDIHSCTQDDDRNADGIGAPWPARSSVRPTLTVFPIPPYTLVVAPRPSTGDPLQTSNPSHSRGVWWLWACRYNTFESTSTLASLRPACASFSLPPAATTLSVYAPRPRSFTALGFSFSSTLCQTGSFQITLGLALPQSAVLLFFWVSHRSSSLLERAQRRFETYLPQRAHLRSLFACICQHKIPPLRPCLLFVGSRS